MREDNPDSLLDMRLLPALLRPIAGSLDVISLLSSGVSGMNFSRSQKSSVELRSTPLRTDQSSLNRPADPIRYGGRLGSPVAGPAWAYAGRTP